MESLGVQPLSLFAQIFNFTVMVVVLTKFLYKPILKVIDERRKKIEESLKLADQIKKEAEENEKKREELLAKAKSEGDKIIEEARLTAKKAGEKILEKATKEAQLIIEKTKKEMELEKKEMVKRLKKETIEAASVMTSHILQRLLGEKEHKIILEQKIKQIQKLAQKI